MTEEINKTSAGRTYYRRKELICGCDTEVTGEDGRGQMKGWWEEQETMSVMNKTASANRTYYRTKEWIC